VPRRGSPQGIRTLKPQPTTTGAARGDEGAGEPPLPPSLRWLAIEENEGAAPQESPTSRLRDRGIEVEFIEGAVGLIAEEGFDPEFGARGP
jgi:C-terminal, D2-small domain, of ClpB protein